jgi:hypothetical protein
VSDLAVEHLSIDSVRLDPSNARRHPSRNIDAIKDSLARFGQQKPLVVDADGIVRAGNGTLEAARALGWTEIAVVRTTLEQAEAVAFAIADNRTSDLEEWDFARLSEQLSALQEVDSSLLVGWPEEEMRALLDGSAASGNGSGGYGKRDRANETLSQRFLVPPFSVLDSRQGYWQERKRAWLSLGIQSEVGRGENLLKMSEQVRAGYQGSAGVYDAGGAGHGSARLWRLGSERACSTRCSASWSTAGFVRRAGWCSTRSRAGADGRYRGLVRETVCAFEDAGAAFYNEAVLVTSLGSLPIRVRAGFEGSRKLGRTHQNVLVCIKGDPAKAAEAVVAVDLSDELFAEEQEGLGGNESHP